MFRNKLTTLGRGMQGFMRLHKRILLLFIVHCSLFIVLLASCAAPADRPESRTRDGLLGTVITLTLYDHASDAVFGAMFDRIGEIEDKMSVNRADSEVSGLNAAAGTARVAVSAETFAVLRMAKEIAELSEGAFDPTVGPAVKLWGVGTPEAHVPGGEGPPPLSLNRVCKRRNRCCRRPTG